MSGSSESPQPSVSETRYPLIVAQHRIYGHKRRTEHWNLALLKSQDEAVVYEVRGNQDSFTYITERVGRFSRSPMFRGGYLVGYIPNNKAAAWLDQQLCAVSVNRGNDNWDCQNWVMDSLRMLKKTHQGVITQDISEDTIRRELSEEDDRWENGEDTVEERLYS